MHCPSYVIEYSVGHVIELEVETLTFCKYDSGTETVTVLVLQAAYVTSVFPKTATAAAKSASFGYFKENRAPLAPRSSEAADERVAGDVVVPKPVLEPAAPPDVPAAVPPVVVLVGLPIVTKFVVLSYTIAAPPTTLITTTLSSKVALIS